MRMKPGIDITVVGIYVLGAVVVLATMWIIVLLL